MEELVMTAMVLQSGGKIKLEAENITATQSIIWMEASMIPRPRENISTVPDQTVRRDRQQEI